MSNYNIYKDSSTKDTIEKIKKILKDNNIPIEEFSTSRYGMKDKLCPSIRVCITNTDIGANGKGTCPENATASGYGEFMERLQNANLVSFKWNDETFIKTKTVNPDLLGTFKLDFDKEEVRALPFYSVRNKEITNIPANIFQSTNGLSAGNTIEEALVQGLSEICERYALKTILLNKLSLPDVPKELYMDYSSIKNIIEYYEENDYKIFVKDASIGKKLPVICTLAVNEKQNVISISCGSHPTLPVAIERTLTEIFQGVNVSVEESKRLEKNIFITKEYFNEYLKNDIIQLYDLLIKERFYFEDNSYLKEQFLTNNPSFEFSPNAWLNGTSETTNKDLLKFLVNNISDITKNNIYVRDVSFLDFPAVHIYIPDISTTNQIDAAQLEESSMWFNYNGGSNKYYDDINSLLRTAECGSTHFILPKISIYPDEYIAMLASIVIGDYEKIIKYSKKLLHKNMKRDLIIKLIRDYYSLKQKGLSEEDIKAEMLQTYQESSIEFMQKFIKSLSFEAIKKMIVQQKTPNPQQDLIDKIRENLTKASKNNMPDQMKLKDVFDFVK